MHGLLRDAEQSGDLLPAPAELARPLHLQLLDRLERSDASSRAGLVAEGDRRGSPDLCARRPCGDEGDGAGRPEAPGVGAGGGKRRWRPGPPFEMAAEKTLR